MSRSVTPRQGRDATGKIYRHTIDARRVFAYGGGACTLLVLRGAEGSVELLFHARPETGAVLTAVQARELAHALTKAI